MIEPMIGFTKMTMLYLLTGIGGFLFSSLLTDDVAVGASVSFYGFAGVLVALLALNWHVFSQNLILTGMVIFFIFYSILFGALLANDSNSIDMWGHFGGFLFGLPIGFFLMPGSSQGQGRAARPTKLAYVAIAVTVTMFGGLFALFYTVRHPKNLF